MSAKTPPVVELFNRIAPVYDFLNRVISWGQDQRWRLLLARQMQLVLGQTILDISVGTGDMTLALQKACREISVVGLDPSPLMISLFRRKVPRAALSLGVAERIPFENCSADRVVCAFGLRNFYDRPAAYSEILRILKPGGLWGFLEMSAPPGRIFARIYAFYFKRLVPVIGAAFSLHASAYKYLRDTVYEFPGFEGMKVEHETAGFALVRYHPILRGAVGLYVFQKRG